MNSDWAIELASDNKRGLILQSPIIIAGGYGVEYEKLVDLTAVGAVVTTAITLYAQRGTAQPRLAEVTGGFVLHTGGHNIGLAKLHRHYPPRWARIGVPVIVGISGSTAEEYGQLAEKLERVRGVAAVELALPADADEDYAFVLTQTTRHHTELPVIVKLPLFSFVSAAKIVALAESVVEAGAHAVTLIAPPRAMAFNRAGQAVRGRLYGVGVKPLALHAVQVVRNSVAIPIIGAGGVHTPDDVREFLAAGAWAVQIDCALFVDPRSVDCIIRAARAGELAPMATAEENLSAVQEIA